MQMLPQKQSILATLVFELMEKVWEPPGQFYAARCTLRSKTCAKFDIFKGKYSFQKSDQLFLHGTPLPA
jgi:hypothetical protein